jgi:hypothetical protein
MKNSRQSSSHHHTTITSQISECILIKDADYGIPILSANAEFKQILKQWFPQGNIFHTVFNAALKPVAHIIQQVEQFKSLHSDHFMRVDGKGVIGVQIRQRKGPFNLNHAAAVAKAIATSHGFVDTLFFFASDTAADYEEFNKL